MTSFNSATATVIKITFTGLSDDGTISIQGLQPGDLMLRLVPDGFIQGYEEVVSTADQLQQLNGHLDWSPINFTAYLLRGV